VADCNGLLDNGLDPNVNWTINGISWQIFPDTSPTILWQLLEFPNIIRGHPGVGVRRENIRHVNRSNLTAADHYAVRLHYWLITVKLYKTVQQQQYPFNGLSFSTIWVSRHQKGKPFWILTKQEMIGWQRHRLDHMQTICTSFQTDNHVSSSKFTFFLQTGCSSRRPANSVKSMKAVK